MTYSKSSIGQRVRVTHPQSDHVNKIGWIIDAEALAPNRGAFGTLRAFHVRLSDGVSSWFIPQNLTEA